MSGNEKTWSPVAPISASLMRVYALRVRGRLLTVVMTAVAALTMVIGYSGAAIAAPQTLVVNCDNPAESKPANNSNIQDAVDNSKGPTTIVFIGLCEEDVTITKDDITLDGQDVGTVSGTITFDGAQRGVLKNSQVTGPGVGVSVINGATAKLQDNTIEDNVSYGVEVFNGAFLRLTKNIITDNGRASHFEAGITVSRAIVAGRGNVITNNRNTGVEVFNSSTYRTGSFLTPTSEDNDGPFEIIIAANTGRAVSLGRMSLADLRQVMVTGNIRVGQKSMLHVRGDTVGENRTCSQIIGNVIATATLAQVDLRFTNVTGIIAGPFIDGGSTPIVDCPLLPPLLP